MEPTTSSPVPAPLKQLHSADVLEVDPSSNQSHSNYAQSRQPRDTAASSSGPITPNANIIRGKKGLSMDLSYIGEYTPSRTPSATAVRAESLFDTPPSAALYGKGRHGNVYTARYKQRLVAVKEQKQGPAALRELRVAQKLRDVSTISPKTNCFLEVLDSAEKTKGMRGNRLMMMMEFVDRPDDDLANFRVTLQEYKSVLLQLLHALAVAQEKCKFMHNDLHLGNIMITRRPETEEPDILYSLNVDWETGTRKRYMTGNVKVKILDYGLSSIEEDEENRDGGMFEGSNNPRIGVFLPRSDVQKLGAEFSGITIKHFDGRDGQELTPEQKEEELKMKSDLLRKMKGEQTKWTARILVEHEFFRDLALEPASIDKRDHREVIDVTRNAELRRSKRLKKPKKVFDK